MLICNPQVTAAMRPGMAGCLAIADVQFCAQHAISFVEGAASEMSCGLPAYVRTIAHCGQLEIVAVSMWGEYAVGTS